jgi:hypothetical protein
MKLLKNFRFICALFVISGLVFFSCTETIEIEQPKDTITDKLSKDENLKEYLSINFQIQRQISEKVKNMSSEELNQFNINLQKEPNLKSEEDIIKMSKLLGYDNLKAFEKDLVTLQNLSKKINLKCNELSGNSGEIGDSKIISKAMEKLVKENQAKKNLARSTFEETLVPPFPQEYYHDTCRDRGGYEGCMYSVMAQSTLNQTACAGLAFAAWPLGLVCGAANVWWTTANYRICFRTFCKTPDPKPVQNPVDIFENQ